ncbi:MAG TPA: hypothetical protein DCF68_02005 [Cyanothece sp. UBA12306]|nr:hypothetical protein [Cyanothece sp. UBA12306]
MDLVSIITPCYHSKPYLSKAIESVLTQNYQSWELLIIADDLADYQSFCQQNSFFDPRLKFLSTEKNGSGPSYARNIGLKAASGNIVALLDSDDYFLPDKLALMVPKVKEYGMASCALAVYLETGAYLRTIGDQVHERGIRSHEYPFINFCSQSMIVWDRNQINLVYDVDVPCLEDLLFVMQCYDLIEEIYHFPQSLHHYCRRQGSLTNSVDTSNKFIETKLKFVDRIKNKTIGINNQGALDTLLKVLEVTFEIDDLLKKGVIEINETALFFDFVEQKFLEKKLLPSF